MERSGVFGLAVLAVAATFGGGAIRASAQESPETTPRTLVEHALDLARAGDHAGFEALIGPGNPDDPVSRETVIMADHRQQPDYLGPIDFERVRSFALACRFDEVDRRGEPDPLGFRGRYSCNGVAGYALSAGISLDRRHIHIIQIERPDPEGVARRDAEWARIQEGDRQRLAAQQREDAQIRGVTDALFEAARFGDQARISSIIAPRAEVGDRRGEPMVWSRISVRSFQPIAAACRRDPEPTEVYGSMDMDGNRQWEESGWLICDARRPYMIVQFDARMRLVSITLETGRHHSLAEEMAQPPRPPR